jgi:hypothetical protein
MRLAENNGISMPGTRRCWHAHRGNGHGCTEGARDGEEDVAEGEILTCSSECQSIDGRAACL